MWDRSCTCNKRKSKKLLQSEYEEINVGPEFSLDARLAQVVAFVWVTFMYSPALPSLFIITAVNFCIIYWIDKTLLLRFYRTPKNYDELSINFSLDMIKNYTFIFHFFIGVLVYSNDKILSGSDDEVTAGSNSIFSLERYNTLHVILFVIGNVVLFFIAMFESTIFSWVLDNISCFSEMKEKF